MRVLHGTVEADGAMVEVQLGLASANVQKLRQAGRPIPPAVTLRALLDPGAEATCVDPQVLAPWIAFGLPPNRLILTNTPALGGSGAAAEYTVGLTIVHPSGNPRDNLVLRNQPVIELALGALGYQALIGRDVLNQCMLIYDGPGKVFTLAY